MRTTLENSSVVKHLYQDGCIVQVVSEAYGWGCVNRGDKAVVVSSTTLDEEDVKYYVDVYDTVGAVKFHGWACMHENLKLVSDPTPAPAPAPTPAPAAPTPAPTPEGTGESPDAGMCPLGTIGEVEELVFGGMYWYTTGDTTQLIVCTQVNVADDSYFRDNGDNLICIDEQQWKTNTYAPPAAGDIIRVTSAKQFLDGLVDRDDLPGVYEVTSVLDPCTVMHPAIWVKDLLLGTVSYMMLPEYEVVGRITRD